MCGIIGVYSSQSVRALEADFLKALARLGRRGPDFQGHWMNTDGNLILGHTRLSILDLSARGNQPKASLNRALRDFVQRRNLQSS